MADFSLLTFLGYLLGLQPANQRSLAFRRVQEDELTRLGRQYNDVGTRILEGRQSLSRQARSRRSPREDQRWAA